MATCERTPESRWSSRWEIGCPTFMDTPLRMVNSFLISAKISSLVRVLLGFNSTSISELLTGSTCSSNSARPVLRLTYSTSGTRSINFSPIVPMRLLSSKDVPAGVEKFIVNEPSLKGGRNSVPKKGTMLAAATINTTAIPMINLGLAKPQCKILVSCRFRKRTKTLSFSSWVLMLFNK